MKTPATLLAVILVSSSASAQQTLQQQQDTWRLQQEINSQQQDIDMLRLFQSKTKRKSAEAKTQQDLETLRLLQQFGDQQAAPQPTEEQQEARAIMAKKESPEEKLADLLIFASQHPRSRKEAALALDFSKRIITSMADQTPSYKSNALAEADAYMVEYLRTHPSLPLDTPCFPFDKIQ